MKAGAARRPAAREDIMKPQSWKHTSVSRTETVAVVAPRKRLVGEEETDELVAIFDALDAERLHCIVVDLGGIDFMSTPGISALIHAHVRFSKRGAHVHLARLDKRIHNLLVITKLALVFDVFGSVEAAIAGAVGKPSPATP